MTYNECEGRVGDEEGGGDERGGAGIGEVEVDGGPGRRRRRWRRAGEGGRRRGELERTQDVHGRLPVAVSLRGFRVYPPYLFGAAAWPVG